VSEEQLTMRFSRPRDGVHVVAASGECDLAEAPKLEEALVKIAERRSSRQVLLDLSDVTYLDSSGIAALWRANVALEIAGSTLVLVAPSEPVRRILALTDLEKWLEIRDSSGLPQFGLS
jgi:anti-sigma B factor antagonist